MKTHCKVEVRTKSGRTHSFEYNYNSHEIMKDTDLVMHILNKAYLDVDRKDGKRVIIPRDAIDCITLTGEHV